MVEIERLVQREGTEVGWIDYSGTGEDGDVRKTVRELGSALADFVNSRRAVQGRGSLFSRGAYTPPDNVYAEMATARNAMASDDVVSATAEITEGMAFEGVKFESPDMDETDIFNQIARTVNLDNYCRQVWREEFATSQAVTASWWAYKEFTVRGKSDKGVKRKKKMTVYCPQTLTILDGTKVVPIGSPFSGVDRLAWHATQDEFTAYQNAADPLLQRYCIGHYDPPEAEASQLAALGVTPTLLLELNPEYVWRHTSTKSDYERFCPVRLRSLFRTLDLKQQLMDADRTHLIGAANYILLVKKGTDQQPATQTEVDNLKENFQVVAKLPVVIGDHRLNIEIITPKLDLTLNRDKYSVLDNRLALRSLGTFHIDATGRSDTSLTIGRAIAKGMQNRRRMIARSIEEHIARAVVEHPLNAGLFEQEPNLVFVPKAIALDMDQVIGTAVQAARNTGDLSRMSFLEHFGFDEFVEAQRREMEKKMGFDDLFQTHVPFDGQGGQSAGDAGDTATGKAKGNGSGGDGGTGQNQHNEAKAAKPKVDAPVKPKTDSPTTDKPK
ncbi:MAG: hypothetical protein ACXVYY_01400 [Oryzihumus sp.]